MSFVKSVLSMLKRDENITFQFGQVVMVDATNKVISVQSRINGDVITGIPLQPAFFQQYVPVVGQQVMLYRIGNYFTGVLVYLASRQFRRPIKDGEFLIEGVGGGRAFFDNGGSVLLSDKMMSNVLKMLSSVGLQFVGDTMSIEVKGIAKVTIKDDQVVVQKVSTLGNVTTAKVTIEDGVVTVDSPLIKLGQAPVIGAAVVSLSGVPGNFSFDPITGQPIPGSTQVKANP